MFALCFKAVLAVQVHSFVRLAAMKYDIQTFSYAKYRDGPIHVFQARQSA
jgi:hypothetical protein